MAVGRPPSTGPRTLRSDGCASRASASGVSQRIQMQAMGRFLVGSLSDTDTDPGTDHSSDALNVIVWDHRALQSAEHADDISGRDILCAFYDLYK